TLVPIALTRPPLAMVTVGSLFVVRSSVGGVTDLSEANQALLRVQTQAIAAQGQIKDYVMRPDDKLSAEVAETLDEAIDSVDDAEDGADAIGETKSLAAVRSALESTRQSSDRVIAE